LTLFDVWGIDSNQITISPDNRGITGLSLITIKNNVRAFVYASREYLQFELLINNEITIDMFIHAKKHNRINGK
jgi:hypothetical protein